MRTSIQAYESVRVRTVSAVVVRMDKGMLDYMR